MLQRHLADILMARTHCPAEPVLARLDIGGFQQKPGSGRRAKVESERSIGTNRDSGGDRDAGLKVRCSGVEFLRIESV